MKTLEELQKENDEQIEEVLQASSEQQLRSQRQKRDLGMAGRNTIQRRAPASPTEKERQFIRGLQQGSAIIKDGDASNMSNYKFLKSLEDGTAKPEDLFHYDTDPLYREDCKETLQQWKILMGEIVPSNSHLSEDGKHITYQTRAEDVRVMTTEELRAFAKRSITGILISPPGEIREDYSRHICEDEVNKSFDTMIKKGVIDPDGFHFLVGAPHSKSEKFEEAYLAAEARGEDSLGNNIPLGVILVVQIQPKNIFDQGGEAFVLVTDDDKEAHKMIENLAKLERRKHVLTTKAPLRGASGNGKSRL